MNKRFSTLLAAALVAGGLSFNANATAYGADDVKDGSFIHLGASSDVLSVNDKSEFGLQSTTTWSGNVDKLLGTLWQVKKTAHTTSAGVQYTYSFVNRLSGQMLSIKLQSVDGTKRENIKANEKQGQTDWAWDGTAGLYCVKNFGAGKDSVFQLGFTANGIQLAVKPGNTAPTSALTSTTALTQVAVSTSPVTLKASDFNVLVEKEGGRLFFTDENVSSTEKNVLTANKWEAVDAKMTNGKYANNGTEVLFLTNGKEYKNRMNAAMTAADETQKEYLLVDYNFYDPKGEFNVLKVDTIATEPTTADADAKFEARTVIAKHHPATAAFTVKYFIPNDSMVIAPAYVPTSIPVATTLEAMHGALPTDGEITAVKTVVDYLEAAVTLFSTKGKATDFPEGAKFAEVKKFTEAGATGDAKTGQDLIDAVKDAIKEVAYSKTDATKKKEEAYVAAVNKYLTALNGLEITKESNDADAALVSTSAIKDGANYVDGLNAMTVDAAASKQVVIRKLSNTKVLTIGADPATPANGNLVATIKTSDKDATIGGDATIAEGLYYVIDAEKEASAGVANKYYGLYFDESPVNAAGYVAKAQAFNPFAQYVVAKAAGVDKGNYTITNRGDETEGWQGVTNVADKDNNIFVIEGDTIQLVAAEDVDADNAYIGFKYITANDAKNNKFTITSAADVLEGQSIV
ncbi:hypothetical protein, partial [uncultured Parabacteroides sp.]|uniref:hypothetical protein n=1 Tax=uncultured Parabacteroides sp. TaxID=512312 RepID=UPI00266DB5B0